MDVVKIVGMGLIISLCVILIKQVKPEMSFAVLVAGSIIMISMIFEYFTNVFGVLDTIINATGIDQELFQIVLKIIGIGYIIEFGAGLCNDTGNTSIGEKMLLAGKILILVISLPIVTSLFDIVIGLIP